MQAMESQFDVCTEDLFNQTIKLEEMEKKAGNAESEVSGLRSRLILLQENNEKLEERLCKATLEHAREPMLLLRRELNLRMRFHQMKKPLITLINSWRNQSSISLPLNQSMMIFRESFLQWNLMQQELPREPMLLRRRLLTLRKNLGLSVRISKHWKWEKRRQFKERKNIRRKLWNFE